MRPVIHSPSGRVRLFLLTIFFAMPAVLAQTPVVRILPLGDSITRGNNDINYPNSDIPGGYRTELASRLTTAGVAFDFVGTQTDNAAAGTDPDHSAFNGFRTDQMLAGLPASLALAPDVVLMHLGTNDILQNIPVTTAAAKIDLLIGQITASAPNRRLYVSTVIPITQSWAGRTAAQLNADASDFNNRLRNLVQQRAALGAKVFLVDMNALIVLNDPDPSKRFFLTGDGIHPGQAGYNQMGRIWFNAIASTVFDPVVNGSFEQGLTGWASAGQVSLKSSTPYFGTDGSKVIAFHPQESARDGVLTQIFPTTAGSTYELAFDAAGADEASGQLLEVKFRGSGDLASQTVSVAGASGGGIAWHAKSVVFVADGPATTLTFTDRSVIGNNTGLLLDHIRLIKRPTPVVKPPDTWTALRAHPQNPYILEFRRRPTVLRTYAEHYSSMINSNFYFVPYLDTLQRDGMNLTRAFLVGFRHDGSVFPATPLAPAPARFLQPWLRSGTVGPAIDGLGKWDFTTSNEEYFNRLRIFAKSCGEHGVVAEITLFCTPYTTFDWQVSPFNPANNVQGHGPADRYDALRGTDANLMAAQEAAVRRIVRELNEFDNLYYEILNEPFWNEPGVKDAEEVAFQNRMLQVIRDTEATLPNKHLVAHNFPQQANAMSPGFDVINEHYPLAVSVQGPNPAVAGAETLLRDHYQRGRILALDETDTATPLQTRLESWMFLLGGGCIYNGLDVPNFIYTTQDETGDTALGNSFRKAVRDIGSYMDKLHLVALRRNFSWLTGGIPAGATHQAMASPGQQYAAYFHHGQHDPPGGLSYSPVDGSNHVITPTVTLPSGSWRAVWTRPSDLTVLRTEEFTHTGGARTLAAVTYQEDVALRIDRTGAGDLTPPPGPTGLISTSNAAGTVLLTWNPIDAADLGNYRIYRSASPGIPLDAAHRIAVVSSSRTDFSDTTATAGSTWHYAITAVDLNGNESIASAETSITPALDNLPYGGTAWTIPGRIEAENFDIGGEGVAWHDLTAGNEGGQYRPSENVDIAATSDAGGGYQVFEMQTREWLEYTINATRTGSHILELRVASTAAGGRVRLEVDGINISGTVEIPQTGGSQIWQTVTVPDVQLSAGPHILRLSVSAGFAGSINWLALNAGAATGPTANAGADLQIADQDNSGSETVSLNAGASSAGDAAIQNYTWKKQGLTIASGPNPSVSLAVGNHLIQLKVTDGNGFESTDEVLVTVRPGGFVNGSFESGYTGWTATGNQAVQSNLPYAATDGTRLASFNGANLTPNGVLSQTFATVAGATYTLAFDAGVLSYNTNSQVLQVTATGSANLLNRTITIAGLSGGSNRWLAQSFTFVADRSTTTLTFRDVSTSTFNLDLVLDNVRITGPPPAIPNTSPVAVADAFFTNENSPLIVPSAGVLANDIDADSNPLTAILVANPVRGSLVLNAAGGFTYTPASGFFGADSFTYRANDGTADSNIATVAITVREVVPAPLAVADSYVIDQNAALEVPNTGVLANDSDERGRPLTAILTASPDHGTLELNPDGTFVYTPELDYFGSDSFTYQANNGVLDSAVVSVAITIDEVVPMPVAAGDAFSTDQNTPLVVPAAGVLANDSDPRSRPLKAVLDQGPAHGLLVLDPEGGFIYTPAENYFGTDSFTYHAENGSRDSAIVTVNVTLTVDGVQPESIALADSYSIQEGGTLTVTAASGVLANDTDTNSAPLTAVLDAGPAHGSLTISADGGFIYTPSGNYFGSDSFSYHANNGTSDSNITTVSLTITEVIPPPVAIDDAYSTEQDAALVIPAAGLLANDSDPRSRPLTAVPDLAPANGSVSVDSDGAFIYIPAAGFFGTDSFSYQAHNGTIASASATVTITVHEIVPPPQTTADSYVTSEGVPLVVPATGVLANDNDPRSHPLTALLETAPVHGTLALDVDGGFHYNPTGGFHGNDSFTYRASNGVVVSDIEIVTLTVIEIVRPPVAAADSYSTLETTALVIPAGGVLTNDADPRQRQLTAALVSGPSHGTLILNADGSFAYNPTAGYFGNDSFTYQARNGVAASNIVTVTLAIAEVIPAPTAVTDTYQTLTNTPFVVPAAGVLANDRDPRSRPLTAVLDSPSSNGAIVLNADGSFTYTPAAGYSGNDSFTYHARNGFRDSFTTTVNLTVRPPAPLGLINGSFEAGLTGWTSSGNLRVQSASPYAATEGARLMSFNNANQTPNAVLSQSFGTIAGQSYTVAFDLGVLAYNTSAQTMQVTVNGTSNLLTRTLFVTGAGNGTNRWLPQAFTFVADGPTATLTFRDQSTATFNLDMVLDNARVTGITNTAPFAAADSYQTVRGTALVVPSKGVLANDSDAESNTLTAMTVTGPTRGELILNANGGFTYTPAVGYAGTDSFSYRANDGRLDSNVVTVTLTVTAPVATTLVNGSFESGFTGWITTGNQGIQSAALYAATDGSRLVAFNSGNQTPNGTLSQSFATTAGRTYSLAFDAGVLAFNSASQTLQVTVNGTASLLTRTITLPGTGSGTGRWQAQAFTFIADGPSTTLTFRDQSATTSNLDLLLDNVRITAQPLAVAARAAVAAVEELVPAPQAIVTPPAPSPGTPSISGAPGNITISMTAPLAGTYSLERSKDLVTWEWLNETPASPGELIESHDASETASPAMFYRIGWVP